MPPQSTHGQGFFGYNPAWTEQGGESPGLFACALQCLSPLPPTELQAKLLSSEAEVKSKLLELDSVKGKLQDASSENTKLLERIKSIEALLEAGQMREAEKDRNLQVVCSFNWGGRRGVGDTAYTIPVLSLLWDPLWDATERADMHHMPGAIKVLSLFQAANEAEVKQLQSRWVQVHILLWHLHVSQASSSTEPVAEGFLPSRQAWGCPAGKSRSIPASSAV